MNKRERDGNDTALNRLTLRIHYRLCHHIFVHTEAMKRQLASEFQIEPDKVTVIPFGLNDTVPKTALTRSDARRKVGLCASDKVLLFFGNIAPYKGLEFLTAAFATLAREDADLRLVIVGRPKGSETYWPEIERQLAGVGERVIQRIEYVPDEETEIYFKAADVLVLPYTHIFQSGVLFLGYNFGLPAIAADVGSLREEIVPGETGFTFRPRNTDDLAERIREYFRSDMYGNADATRERVRRYAQERYSWATVARLTTQVYERLLRR